MDGPLSFQMPGDDPINLALDSYHLRRESDDAMQISDPELRHYKMDAVDSDGTSHIIVNLNSSASGLPHPGTFLPDGTAVGAARSFQPVSFLTSSPTTNSSRLTSEHSDNVVVPGTPLHSTNVSSRTGGRDPSEQRPCVSTTAASQPYFSASGVDTGNATRNGSQVGTTDVENNAIDPNKDMQPSFDSEEPRSQDKREEYPSSLQESPADKEANINRKRRFANFPWRRWVLILAVLAGGALAGIICGTGNCSFSEEHSDPTPPVVDTQPPAPTVPIKPDVPIKNPAADEINPAGSTAQENEAVLEEEPVTTTVPTDADTDLDVSSAGENEAVTADASVIVATSTPTDASDTNPPSFFPDDLPQSTKEAMNDLSTPQGRAFLWIQNHPNLNSLPDWRKRQLFAMVTFFHAFDGYNNWPLGQQLNWLNYDVNECEWNSIQTSPCTFEGELEFLGLLNIPDLQGSMPPEVALLTNLEELSIEDCNVVGNASTMLPLPILESLTNLRRLDLEGNVLTGSLPTELGLLTSLLQLDLQDNTWSGPLVSELGLLSSLTSLDVSNTALSGTIPLELGSLSALEEYYVTNSGLTGTIPDQVCELPSLSTLQADCGDLATCCPTN